MTAAARSAPSLAGPAAYALICIALSWLTAFSLRDAWREPEAAVVTRLLAATLLYAVTMGWQPLVAVVIAARLFGAAPLSPAARARSRRSHLVIAGCVPVLLTLAAAVMAPWLDAAGMLQVVDGPILEPDVSRMSPSWSLAATLFIAFGATLLLLFGQAVAEEIGWRGYFMSLLVERFGATAGLLWHGAVWGLSYAPIFWVTSASGGGAMQALAFVVTCALLGTVLGWLRLLSGSFVAPTVANATLSLSAGLPFVLLGVERGARGAVYGPAGWAPLLVCAVCVALWARER